MNCFACEAGKTSLAGSTFPGACVGNSACMAGSGSIDGGQTCTPCSDGTRYIQSVFK
jgi:hypothetical protein